MNKTEIIEISDNLFKNINYYVIHHDFELEVFYLTNDNLNKRLILSKRLVFNGDSLEIMYNFISYIFDKVITQIIIKSLDKTIKVFVRDRKELLKWLFQKNYY